MPYKDYKKKNEVERNRYWKNRERKLKQMKEYYQEHKKEILLKRKLYAKENRDKINKYTSKWRKGKGRVFKRKNDRLYYKRHVIKRRLKGLIYRAFEKYSETGKIWESSKYGINYKAIIEYLGPCPGDIKNYHIHHIKFLHTFNLNNSEEIKQAFAPENHMWLTIEEHQELHSFIKF